MRRPGPGPVTSEMQPSQPSYPQYTPPYAPYPSPSSAPYPAPLPTGRPAGLPPVKRPLRRLAVLAAVTVAAIGVFLGGFWLWSKLAPRHRVLVENGNDFAVDVEVAGEKIQLAPRSALTLKAKSGTLEVRATGPDGFEERASLELPDAGWASGRTAVYNVNGASTLAVVTLTYGTVPGAPPPLVEISKAERLQLLPGGASYGDIDEGFPSMVRSKRSGEYVQRVCRVDFEKKHIGCPNT
ncbi:MAG: hypothetical protein KF773_35155 [Deltaproteobacteria bacterium]|nr:hypothetical protein [Deltaproteobacteria bacterium]